MAVRIALIDNYDSYTHNLAHALPAPRVIRADAHATLPALLAAEGPFDAYVLSPGPGSPARPADFPPLERDILFAGKPVLAVCLGHQALCHFHGAAVAPNPAGPAHGMVAPVTRAADCPLLRGLPPRFRVVRYHSLCATCPPSLVPTSYATDVDRHGVSHRILMSVRHATKPLFGVQFHPESVATPFGPRLINNFVNLVCAMRAPNAVQRPLPPSPSPSLTPAKPSPTPWKTCVRRAHAALSTPEIFARLFARSENAFWLDSSSATQPLSRCSSPGADPPPRAGARFSILGGDPSELVTYTVGECVRIETPTGVRKFQASIFDYLRTMGEHRFAPNHPDLPMEMNGGYVGFLGYECKADASGVRRNRHRSNLPDAWFAFADRFILVDHRSDDMYLVSLVQEHDIATAERWFDQVENILDQPISDDMDDHPVAPRKEGVLKFTPEQSRSAYLDDIRECLEQIRRGESYEICLTNRLRTRLPAPIDPFDLYCALRIVNPAPYSAFLKLGDVAVCCSSPERYLQISSDGHVESKPIKGTLPRGTSLAEDARLRRELENSEKDRRENLMIVDLVRNDLSRSCVVGTVKVPKLMHVESYATVHQLVSTVVGRLQQPGDVMGCVRAAYPMGSMTGAPKVRTMEIIDRLEHSARGIYSGSIGYVSVCGAADMNVVIRTAVLQHDQVDIGVGGAIVAMSKPEDEYDEVVLKGRAIMQALALKVTGRPDYVVVHETTDAFPKVAD